VRQRKVRPHIATDGHLSKIGKSAPLSKIGKSAPRTWLSCQGVRASVWFRPWAPFLALSSTPALDEARRCGGLNSEQAEYGGNNRGNGCQDGKDDGGNGIQHDSDQVRD
jgi:hypothetical protein